MHILITAGGTREYLDPVRFISNASSGRMGYALGRAAIRAGHTVTLITAPTTLRTPAKAKVINVETSKDMFHAVQKHFAKCDCLIMAAAVSDYAPVRTSKRKLKKSEADLTIKLKPTRDILAWAGKNKKGRIVVGFALEDRAIRRRAENKLKEKRLDMIVANTPSAIGVHESTVQIKTADGQWREIAMSTKNRIAGTIIRRVEALNNRASD